MGRGQVLLFQPQYKPSIDHHRERSWSLSFTDTWRVPWFVLTILPRPSCCYTDTKCIHSNLVYTDVLCFMFGIIQLAFSRVFSSRLQTMVPSGMWPTGITLPMVMCAFLPQYTNCPVYIPSAATNSSFFVLYLYGTRKWATARGAPRPGSWMMSLMTPLMYPCLSEKSTALRAGLPFLCFVCEVKMDPAPLRWALITRPISLVEVPC